MDEPLAVILERELALLHGPLMTSKSLWTALGYCSADAFRQAVSRGTAPILIFPIEKRKGKFALTKDVAQWIAAQREHAAQAQSAAKSKS